MVGGGEQLLSLKSVVSQPMCLRWKIGEGLPLCQRCSAAGVNGGVRVPVQDSRPPWDNIVIPALRGNVGSAKAPQPMEELEA